jgi:hypothetical protein
MFAGVTVYDYLRWTGLATNTQAWSGSGQMESWSNVWSWLLKVYVPATIGWILYVRGAFVLSAEGVLITAGYWGLVTTLLVATVAGVSVAKYAAAARRSGAVVRIPANTLLEGEKQRDARIAWASLIFFTGVVLISMVTFMVRYGESAIHCWDARSPIANGFWASRVAADVSKCGPNETAGHGLAL